MMRPPRELGRDDLVAAYFLIARPGRDGVATVAWPERIAAITAAGFAGMGTQPADYLHARDAHGDRALHALLDEHGIGVVEIDGFPVRYGDDSEELRRRKEVLEDAVMACADAFAARHTVYALVPPGGVLGPLENLAEDLARACDRAAAHELIVSVEYVPWGEPINDAAKAWELVKLVDRANCGVHVDFWHHHAGADDRAVLEAVPGDKVTSLHLTDGIHDLGEPDPLRRTQRQRKLPGDGTFPLADTITTLDAMGVHAPFTVEVVTLEHLRDPPADYARLAYTTSRRALELARSRRP